MGNGREGVNGGGGRTRPAVGSEDSPERGGAGVQVNRYPLFPEDSEVSYTAAMGQPDVGRADSQLGVPITSATWRNPSTWPSTSARHADAPEGSVLRYWHLRNTLHL